MHTPQTAVTLYPGQYWRQYPETFDRILLDAPCSGEGTLYKGTDAVKNWHIKSIKKIAELQKKLLQAALIALKTGGEMVYSTCSLNDKENEDMITFIEEKYGDAIEVCYQKKFWPHIDHTGGFFMVKIRKKSSIHTKDTFHTKNTNEKILPFHRKITGWNTQDDIKLYTHEQRILAVKNSENVAPILRNIYCMRFGETIGYLDSGKFTPTARAFRDILPEIYTRVDIDDTLMIDTYLR